MNPILVFRGLSGLFALLFTGAALVQFNDPDPAVWVAVHLAAAVLSALASAKFPPLRSVRRFAAGLAVLVVIWALSLMPRWIETRPPLDQVLSTRQMILPGVEEARESLGLLLVAAWMGGILLAAKLSKTPGKHAENSRTAENPHPRA